MFHTTTSISILLLVLLAALKFGWSWVEEGINEQFYSQSAVDAVGQSIPMSSYTGKVMRSSSYYFHKGILILNLPENLFRINVCGADYRVF